MKTVLWTDGVMDLLTTGLRPQVVYVRLVVKERFETLPLNYQLITYVYPTDKEDGVTDKISKVRGV